MVDKCPDCEGLEYIKYDLKPGVPDFGKLHPCPNTAFHSRQTRARLFAQSGLKDHERFRMDDLIAVEDVTGAMIGMMKDFMVEPKGWLYLWGGFGVGKTVALQAVVYESVQVGIPAYYTTMADLADLMRAVFNPPKARRSEDEDAWAEWDTFQSRFDRLVGMDLLALDEFDKLENVTDFAAEFRGRLLDHRYRDGAAGVNATLFASNSPPSTLPTWIKDRVEEGKFTVFEHTGASVRPHLER